MTVGELHEDISGADSARGWLELSRQNLCGSRLGTLSSRCLSRTVDIKALRRESRGVCGRRSASPRIGFAFDCEVEL